MNGCSHDWHRLSIVKSPAATINTTTPLTTIWKINNSNSNNICKSCLLEQHLAGNQTTLVLNSAKFPQKAATRPQLDINCNGMWMNWDANWDVSWDVSCDGSSRIIIPNNNVKFQQQRMAPNTIVVRPCCRGCQLLGSWRCCCSCKLKCIEFPIKNVLQIKKKVQNDEQWWKQNITKGTCSKGKNKYVYI